MSKREYSIPFTGLKVGNHQFEYNLKETFFEDFGYHDFNTADISAEVQLNKTATMLEFNFKSIKGTVNVFCDVTGEPFDMELPSCKLQLIVKFGEDYEEVDDELIVIPHGENQVDISQYLYEMIVLGTPQKRVHPGVEDGTLQSDILDKLKSLAPKLPSEEEKEETDPRWDSLKKLLTDK